MALTARRYRVGGTSADVTQSADENNVAYFAPGVTLWAFSAKTDGVRYLDLSLDGVTGGTSELTSTASGQVPEFYTEVGEPRVYVQAVVDGTPVGDRVLVAVNDLYTDIDALDQAIDNIAVEAGVLSINGQDGDVTLTREDLGAASAQDVAVLQENSFAVCVELPGGGFPPRPDATYVEWRGVVGGGTDPKPAAHDGYDSWVRPDS